MMTSPDAFFIFFQTFGFLGKMMIYPAIFFSFFQNSNFSGFSKFNKCQKEILRCPPPYSHVCDFLNKRTVKCPNMVKDLLILFIQTEVFDNLRDRT